MSSEGLLWVDKYRPSTFSELSYHPALTDNLRALATPDIPHLLFYGPSGAGKRTRAHCVLRALFGSAVEKRKVLHRAFKMENKNVEVTTLSSPYHIEINPSESGNNDRLVIQELIKDMASSAPLDAKKTIKLIVLHDVDQMSRLAQQALRRTMERYSSTCRVLMIAESATKVLEPLRSRCVGIRVGLPTEPELISVLQSVASKEGITLPPALAQTIATTSARNLRRALLQFEATRVSIAALELPAEATVMLGDWEYVCQEVAIMLTRSQTVTQLVAVRKSLQELLSHAVPPDVILRSLLEQILRIADDEICPEICRVAAKFDRNLTRGTKPIFHLEAFSARFMQIYAAFLKKQAAMMD